MKVIDIIRECNGKLLCGDEKKEVFKFSKDTRTIKSDEVYVGIKGSNFDGNDYIDSAFDKGCNIAVVDKMIDYSKYNDKTIIYVEDSIKALGSLAKYKRSLFGGEVVCITGSVGKTTTKDLIVKVLSSKYKVLYSSGNSNNHIGLPLSILNGEDSDVWVLEMGMNNFGEISYLSNIAKPTLAVITNIGTAHIGNLGSRENILKAKLEILDGMKDKKIIINNDNDLLHEYSLHNKCITVGINNKSDYMGKIVDDKVYFNDKSINLFSSEVPFVLNSLLAYACGSILNISFEDISDSLSGFILEGNRLNLVKSDKGYTIINDSYNASYDSVKLSIDILSKYKNRRIFVFADILELGDYSKDIHINIGKLVKERNIDMFICVGKNSYYSYEYVKNNSNIESYHFDSNSEAYDYLNKILDKDDIVLFKGSNAMKLNEIVNKLLKCN